MGKKTKCDTATLKIVEIRRGLLQCFIKTVESDFKDL